MKYKSKLRIKQTKQNFLEKHLMKFKNYDEAMKEINIE